MAVQTNSRRTLNFHDQSYTLTVEVSGYKMPIMSLYINAFLSAFADHNDHDRTRVELSPLSHPIRGMVCWRSQSRLTTLVLVFANRSSWTFVLVTKSFGRLPRNDVGAGVSEIDNGLIVDM